MSPPPRWTLPYLLLFLFLVPASGPAQSTEASTQEQDAPARPESRFRSPDDGWFDVSAFLDEPWGFLPIAVPITEPAVGYGGAGGLAFIGKPSDAAGAGLGRPNISMLGGLGTENGTWGVFAGDLRHWNDRVQTLVGVFDASINLDFRGLDADAIPGHAPLEYNLGPIGGVLQAKYRLGESRAWVGLHYMLAVTDVGFEAPPETPGLPDADSESRVGGVTPSFTYDSRDTLFTPARGTYVEASFGFFGAAFGGEDAFERGSLIAMQFVTPHPQLAFGMRGDLGLTFGDAPFYLRPYVSLRGAPVLGYQGEQAASVETELRWQFWKRFSLVGFVGVGAAWNAFERFEDSQSLTTGGGGFRYELARRYKLHAGIDVAFGPDGPALYVQVGSAWMRP